MFRHQQQASTPSRGRRGNQPNVWYNRTAYSQVSSVLKKKSVPQTMSKLIITNIYV